MGYTKTGTNAFTQYVYDHAGQRILKGTVTGATSATNGQSGTAVLTLDNYTTYVNPYYVVTHFSNADNISKHYYMGMQRFASNLGVGRTILPVPNDEPGSGGGEPLEKSTAPIDEAQTANPLLENLIFVLGEFGKKAEVDYTPKTLFTDAAFEDYYPDDVPQNMQTETNKTSSSAISPPASGGGIGIDFEGGPINPGTLPSPRLLYYYHPDYLGNVEYITDASGLPYQYFLYTPWGEALQDQKANSSATAWDSPYKFNGKEQDEETGLYYYGARYYNPQVSVWLGVDAMAGNAHNLPLSPYNFSANNPIMFVDPDGNDWYTTLGDNPGDPVWFEGSDERDGYKRIGAEGWGFNGETGQYTHYTKSGESQVIENLLAETTVTAKKYEPDQMSQAPTNWRQDWESNDSFLGNFSYNFANDIYVTLQAFDFGILDNDAHTNPFGGSSFHNIDGSSNYKQTDAFVNIASTVAPVARTTKIAPFGAVNKTMPKGLGYIKPLTAPLFSSTFKGNLSRLSPSSRGAANNLINSGIGYWNNKVTTGLILFKTSNFK